MKYFTVKLNADTRISYSKKKKLKEDNGIEREFRQNSAA